MIKTTIYVGLLDQKTKAQEINTLDAFKIVANIFAETTGGATITEGTGVYTHEDGTVIIEPTLVCIVYGVEGEQIDNACKMIKVALNQENLIAETTESNSRMI